MVKSIKKSSKRGKRTTRKTRRMRGTRGTRKGIKNKEFIWVRVPVPRVSLIKFRHPRTANIYTLEVPHHVRENEWLISTIPNHSYNI